jgi:hypothetical protein
MPRMETAPAVSSLITRLLDDRSTKSFKKNSGQCKADYGERVA